MFSFYFFTFNRRMPSFYFFTFLPLIYLWKELTHIPSEESQFPDECGAYATVSWVGEEQDGFHTTYLSVDVRLFALILEVFDTPHATHQVLGTQTMCKVYGKVVIRHHLQVMAL